MSTKQFYLLGESPSTAREIEIPSQPDLEGLQQLIASHFAIVEARDTFLTTVADVLSSEEPVAITIDGKAVREVPGPKGYPYVGNYFEIFPDHLGNHQRLFDTYGPLIKTTNFGSTVYSTNDPKLSNIVFSESDFFTKIITKDHPLYPIKNTEAGIFLGDTDTEEWRTAHKFLPPALGPKAVRHYAPTMQKTVEDSFKVFDELDERGEAWNVYPYMLKLGSQAVGKLVLGMDFQHFTSPDAPPHEMVMNIAESLELNKKITAMGSWYAKLPFGDPKRLANIKLRIEELLTESVNKATVTI
ncbi:cytochrome P450 [Nemania abortiva]|nr:cytochrome P450 [Nemania abortiva]